MRGRRPRLPAIHVIALTSSPDYLDVMVVRKRLSIQGPALVFVTTTVTDWVPVFINDKIACAVLDQLQETVSVFSASIVGYVLMPTHLHALLGLPAIERLSDLMKSFKSLNARRIEALLSVEIRDRLTTGAGFRLWKPRFDDLVIYGEEQFAVKLNYIHNNPVKAGLVARPEKWRFSSAGDWLGLGKGRLTIDQDCAWMKG